MPMIHLIDLGKAPIYEQLRLEEGLLRGTDLNVCLVNRGSNRAIVLGISGQLEELVDVPKAQSDGVEILRRMSGGGTVIVDEETLFLSLILNKNALSTPSFPESILRWSGALYEESWKIPQFRLVENDYVIGEKKCGGNAQYFQKHRWLHHTSFLWDYQDHNMEYLRLPAKRPVYRNHRSHTEFLCRLKQFAPSKEGLIEKWKHTLGKRFEIVPTRPEEIPIAAHRQSVRRETF